jgi:hypothetical protein
VMTTLESVAAAVVVASVRPATLATSPRPRTMAATAPVQGSGLPFFGAVNRPTAHLTYDRKAVITQDPHPVSGKQLRSHPPV